MNQFQFYQVLHRNPCVAYCKVPWVDYFAPRFEVDQPLAIICATNWKLGRKDKAAAIDWAKYHEQKYGHHIEFLLDRPDEVKLFRDEYGLKVTAANPNALSDERIYRVHPKSKRPRIALPSRLWSSSFRLGGVDVLIYRVPIVWPASRRDGNGRMHSRSTIRPTNVNHGQTKYVLRRAGSR